MDEFKRNVIDTVSVVVALGEVLDCVHYFNLHLILLRDLTRIHDVLEMSNLVSQRR